MVFSFYIVPLDSALKGGAYGALAGQDFLDRELIREFHSLPISPMRLENSSQSLPRLNLLQLNLNLNLDLNPYQFA